MCARSLSTALAFVAAAGLWTSSAVAQCPDVIGDLTGDGARTIVDVQCSVLVVTSQLGGTSLPPCLTVPLDEADLSCDGNVNVVDIQLSITLVLTGQLPLAIDADGSGCADACEGEICGNGTCGEGEDCLGCPDDCECVPTAFRIDSLFLVDPHLFATVPFLGCVDLNNGILGDYINTSIAEQLAEPDALDLLLVFRPLAPQVASTPLEIIGGDCEAGVCTAGGAVPVMATANNKTSGSCFAPAPGSLTPAYGTGPDIPTAPCFTAPGAGLALDVGTFVIPFTSVVAAGGYSSLPAGIETGVLAGFVTDAAIAAVILPADLPIVGGKPLSSLLKGGAGNTCGGDDGDVYNGVSGYWFYFEYTAQSVAWVE